MCFLILQIQLCVNEGKVRNEAFYEYGVGITAIFLLPIQPPGMEKFKYTV